MRKTTLAIAVLGTAALGARSEAAILMLDFGPTSVGTATTLSPYHSANPAFTDTVWNTSLGTSDVSAGALKYSDNTTATGVSLNLGITSGTSSVLGTQPSSSSALGVISTGIYGGTTSAARDGIFNNTTGISIQVSGLSAGQYEIFYVGRNTNRGVGDNYTQTLRAAAASPAASFDYSGYAANTITYGSNVSNSNVDTWVLGQNYAKLSVTIGAGDVLNLAFTGTGVDTRGFVNSVQIAAVPEPTSLGAGALLLTLLRRKRGSRRDC